MAERLRALSMLAGKEAAGAHFFEMASRALATGLGCRWAGFGKRAGSKNDIDIIAFCDAGALGPCFSYSLDDSPCGEVYRQQPEDPFCEFPDDVTSLFSGPEVLKQIGAYSYRGEAMFDPTGTPLAHVFVIHDGPLNWSAEETAFFRMVAQRAGSEYNRLQTEAELVAARDQAQASDRAKTEFLTNTSHELRTPLNSIIGLSDMIATAGVAEFPEDQVTSFMGEIKKSGVELLGMIDELLDISRIELGYIDLDETDVHVHACFDSCAETVRGMLYERDISLELAADSMPLRLFADRNSMMRILINLVGNAVKFSDRGATVRLSAGINAEGNAVISVADDGIGIADADLDKVLSYFGQIDSGLDRGFSGTGIGLPMAKRLAEEHGGTLAIQSSVGVGTTVSVLFPAVRVLSGIEATDAA